MTKNVFILEVDCELLGVYENKQSAILEGVIQLLNDASVDLDEHSALKDIETLVKQGYIEDYIYIYEKPFHGDLT